MPEVDERVGVVVKVLRDLEWTNLRTARRLTHEERADAILRALDAYQRENLSRRLKASPDLLQSVIDSMSDDERAAYEHARDSIIRAREGRPQLASQESPSDRDLLRAVWASELIENEQVPASDLYELGLLRNDGLRRSLTDKAREAVRAAINREEA